MSQEFIDTCGICNKWSRVKKHYDRPMCNTCYHLCQRMRTRHFKETGVELDRDEMLTKATTRRMELKETGKWSQSEKNRVRNIRITILK